MKKFFWAALAIVSIVGSAEANDACEKSVSADEPVQVVYDEPDPYDRWDTRESYPFTVSQGKRSYPLTIPVDLARGRNTYPLRRGVVVDAAIHPTLDRVILVIEFALGPHTSSDQTPHVEFVLYDAQNEAETFEILGTGRDMNKGNFHTIRWSNEQPDFVHIRSILPRLSDRDWPGFYDKERQQPDMIRVYSVSARKVVRSFPPKK